jgi:hypothetical protein
MPIIKHIHNGAVTNHQDQVIILHNLKIKKTRNDVIVNPMILSILIFL